MSPTSLHAIPPDVMWSADTLKIARWTTAEVDDWPGRTVLTILLQGCPWSCTSCQTPELRDPLVPGSVTWQRLRDVISRSRSSGVWHEVQLHGQPCSRIVSTVRPGQSSPSAVVHRAILSVSADHITSGGMACSDVGDMDGLLVSNGRAFPEPPVSSSLRALPSDLRPCPGFWRSMAVRDASHGATPRAEHGPKRRARGRARPSGSRHVTHPALPSTAR